MLPNLTYLSIAMAAIVNTEATMAMCVMKVVILQNPEPNVQSLGKWLVINMHDDPRGYSYLFFM